MPANAFTATVRKTPAGPVLLLNGQPAPPVMFFTNTDVQRTIDLQLKEIELAGRHGVNLLSVTMWVPWPEPGQAPSFGGIDARIRSVLKANPGALLIPRTGVTWPPAWWKEAHPDELMLFDDGKRPLAPVEGRGSPALPSADTAPGGGIRRLDRWLPSDRSEHGRVVLRWLVGPQTQQL